jgi:hypothetical protein
MRFDCRERAGLLLIVLLWGSMAAGRVSKGSSEITVLVNNSAGVSEAILSQAKAEASQIFRAAGIEVDWVDCPRAADMKQDDACRRIPGSNDFVLHIVATGRTSSDLVFGLSFLGEDGAGKYSNIFYERVEQAHRQSGANVAGLLGAVAAHELGHLLLGLHAHSYGGIMAAVWREEELRNMGMGTLGFNGDQATRMRARIRGGERTLLSVRAIAGRTMRGVDF